MGISPFRSAGRATAVFEDGVTRAQAWSYLTKMFDEHSLMNLEPYTFDLILVQRGPGNRETGLGDVFEFRRLSGGPTRHMKITEWNPMISFAYSVGGARPSNRVTMRLTLGDSARGITLNIQRTESGRAALWQAIFLRPGKWATERLKTMLSPHNAVSWREIPLRKIQIEP